MDTSIVPRNATEAAALPPVTAILVPDVARWHCLPRQFGELCVLAEHTVYDMMAAASTDYDGGYWRYYLLSNGGFYMAPDTDHAFRIACAGNGFSGVLGSDAAGVVACGLAFSRLSFLTPGGARFVEAFYRVRDYALTHVERRAIFAALD